MSTALTPHPEYVWNAETIRGLRKHLRMSQSSFSKQLGVRQQTVSEWETGVYEPRGASSTLLSLVASNAGYGINAAPVLERSPQPARAVIGSGGYSNGRIDTSGTVNEPSRFDPVFPPAAPSTERDRFSTTHGESNSVSGINNMSRREIPM